MRKYTVFAIFAFLLITPVAIQSVHATSATDSWYPGKGLKQGDYFTYNVCWTDWHNCTPFQMNFWVKNETSDGNGWNVVFGVVDGSNIQKGIMTIGKITPDPTSFDTYVVGWHKGVDNKIWVDSSVPFPVKALVFVDVTTGVPPPDYTLELLKMGNSQTEPDIFTASSTTHQGFSPQCDQPNMEQDSVHQTTTTDSSSMIVEYRYSPSNPHEGCPVEYRLSFEKNFDQTQKYSNVQYDIFTTDDQGKQMSSIAQGNGRQSLYAPVGDDDVTTILKGSTPMSHVVIAVLGTGAEGQL